MELGVYKAINAVQGELCKEGIGKDRKNEQQHYKFRGIDDVYNALSPLLAKHGLCIVPNYTDRSVTERETQKGGVLFYVVVKGSYTITAASDGSTLTAQLFGEAMDSGDKATNKAMSAAYKYLCLQLFSIPTEGDNDADSSTHDVKGSKEAAQAVGKARVEELKAKGRSKLPEELQKLLAMDPEDAYPLLKEKLTGVGGEDFAKQCYADLRAQGISPKNDPEMFIKGLYRAYLSNMDPEKAPEAPAA